VRLDEQKGHFGPAWVCLDFATIVTFSCFASFLDRLPDVLGPFFIQTCAWSVWFWPYEPMRKYFGMPYVRLDEQKGHFGPTWVCLDFATIVTFSGFSPRNVGLKARNLGENGPKTAEARPDWHYRDWIGVRTIPS
jgi:hypothetical protein